MESLCISIVAVEMPKQKNFSLRPPVLAAFNAMCEAYGERRHSVVATAAILMLMEAEPDERERRIVDVSGAYALDARLKRLVDEAKAKGIREAPVRGAESIPSPEWPVGAPGVPEQSQTEELRRGDARKARPQPRSLPAHDRSGNRKVRPRRSPDSPAD
jgi:hypothetical protein